MNRDFSALAGQRFDLLVCGGGIYGAWTAYDAALRGLRVALVEQGDWAGATSSASSKLIHGGLRYLETYDFKLVKKALTERTRLLENAPHRVWPLRFGVPIYADSRISRLQLKAGLTLYDALAGFPGPDMAHRRFDAAHFAERFPLLDAHQLRGGFTYADAQTDDSRLVLELVAGAMAHGAVCVNYCKLSEFAEENGRINAAQAIDQIDGGCVEVRARQVVNTAGQWIAASNEARRWCRLTKGIHLVLPAAGVEEALLLTAKSDGRVFFIIPWYGRTLLGTTDTDFHGDLDNVAVEPEEIDYLLDAANHYLRQAWTRNDVIGHYAGLRVMKRSDNAAPSSISRDWELKTASNGVHYSIGGKITSAREDAAVIVDVVCSQLGVNRSCPTRGGDFPWKPEGDFAEWEHALAESGRGLGIDLESALWLARRHGKNAAEVLRLIEDDLFLASRIVPVLPLIHADLLYCARREMVVHLDDLLRRRLPLLILDRLEDGQLRRLGETVAAMLGWNSPRLTQEIARCRVA